MGVKIGLNCNNSNLEGYFNARRVYFNAVHPQKVPQGPGAKIGPAGRGIMHHKRTRKASAQEGGF